MATQTAAKKTPPKTLPKTDEPLFVVERLEIDKETPGTFRYREVTSNGMPPKLKTQYIQRWLLGEDPPEAIRIEVHAL